MASTSEAQSSVAKSTRRSKKTSPLQRSKKLLEESGYTVAIVERWNPFAKVRQDLFGIIDLLAIGKKTIGIQVTTLGHKKDHLEKMQASPNLQRLLDAGWIIELHSWRKLKEGWKVDLHIF